ncbi:MAG: hypothetical protein HPY82_05800 [Gammaproteobacteria bacterium]|nr:hypothetical protein [Gammaproteobacteria bacterium]
MLKKLDGWLVWLEQAGLERMARKAWVALQLRVNVILLGVWLRVPLLREQYERQNAVIESLKQANKRLEDQRNRAVLLVEKYEERFNKLLQHANELEFKSARECDLQSKIIVLMNEHTRQTRVKPHPMDGQARELPVGSGQYES